MGNFVSNGGKWYAAKEKIALVNKGKEPIFYKGKEIAPGDPFIYEGADREALKALNEAGEEFLGKDFKRDPDFLQAVRNMGFQSGEQGVKDYLEMIGYNEKEEEERFKKISSVVKRHELPEKAKEIVAFGGGKDTTGNRNNDIVGGFGDERVRPASEVKV